MSWNVEILGAGEKRVCAVTVTSDVNGYRDLVSTCLDADNLRILIDALHCALDILKPDWAPTPKEME